MASARPLRQVARIRLELGADILRPLGIVVGDLEADRQQIIPRDGV